MRTALVTGATSGVGQAIALALAGAGHRVLAVGRNRSALAAMADGHRIVAVEIDVRDHAGLERRLSDEPIDILVNNAGLMPPLLPFDEMATDTIESAIAVNLTAAVLLSRVVAGGMCQRGRGHIFFTGSTAGHAPFPRMAVYSATKAAIGAFADGLRLDLSPQGVKVTEIVAGRTETNLYKTLVSEEMRAAMYAGGTAVQPKDIADMVLAVLALPATANVARFDIVPTRQATATGAVKKET